MKTKTEQEQDVLLVKVLRTFGTGATYCMAGEERGFGPAVAHRLVLEELAAPVGWSPDPEVQRTVAAELFATLEADREDHGIPERAWAVGRRGRIYRNIAAAVGAVQEVVRG